jgi:D-3-phosphoglycerate dehydrogenase
MAEPFRLGITRDFLKPDGSLDFGDIGLGLLEDHPRLTWEFLAENHDVVPRQVADQYDALLVLKPRIAAETVSGCNRLSLVARFGVGYDSVDVDACTRNHVMLTITPDGVRRPVAVAALAFLLALSHKLLIKDRITREGRWDDKLSHMGIGLTGRVLGVIGLGNIGREFLRVAAPLDMRHVAHDPFVTREQAAAAGAEWMELDALLEAADFVVITCALTPQTHHLLDARRLARMRSSACLINVARGPIVDQAALTAALEKRQIAAAALDVFEQEPVDPREPLLRLENVIVAPHAICWTDELFRDNGRSAIQSVLAVAAGQVPRYVVNSAVLESQRLKEKLRQFA